MNIAGITGHLTRDPELRTTPDNKSVTVFCVAVKRPYSKDKTDFIDCVAWGNIAEFLPKYFSKGSGISVDGCLTTRTWEDKDGNKRKNTELTVSNVGFMGSKSESKGTYGASSQNESSTMAANAYTKETAAEANAEQTEFMEIDGDDDLPF